MRFKYLTVTFILAFALILPVNEGLAKCENSTKVINSAQNVILNPNEKNIDAYISLMKRRAIFHGFKRDYEAKADDLRSILYFLRKDKKCPDYVKYYQKLKEANSKLGFEDNQNNRLEIAKNLYLEEKYFASAYEFLELAGEDYSKDICYEYLGDISNKFNNPKSALIFYEKALVIEPENYCITYKAGVLYKKLGKEDLAKDFFEKTINLTEDYEILSEIIKLYEADEASNQANEEVYEILGLAYQRLKEYQKTYDLFVKAINMKPDDIFLKYYLGNLLFEMGEYQSAINVYDSIIASNPYETQIRIARAKSLNATGRLNDAIKDYQVVLALYPNSKQAQYGMFKLLSGKKSTDNIIKTFYPLNKNFTPNAAFYNSLGETLYQKNMIKDAINVYKKSIATAPRAPEGYVKLFRIYELEGQTANSYELAKQAYKNLPNNPEIKKIYEYTTKASSTNKSNLALSYMANKEYAKAIKIYNQIQPKDAGVYESLANCYKALKNYKAAANSLNQAIKLEPVNSDLYYSLALVYLDLNNKKTAEGYLEKAIGLDKNNLKAKKLLGYIKQQEINSSLGRAYNAFKKKNYKVTIEELNKAQKMHPDNPDVYYYKGLTYNALNDTKKSYENFIKTLQIDRSYYTCHYYIAEILEKQGKERQALEEYERFLGAEVKDEKMLKKAQDKVIKLGEKYY